MRDLGARVGMRAQSRYSYFASKDKICAAMFLQGIRMSESGIDLWTAVLNHSPAHPGRNP